MDLRGSWEKNFHTMLQLEESNIIVQTDGGLRNGEAAAAAAEILRQKEAEEAEETRLEAAWDESLFT